MAQELRGACFCKSLILNYILRKDVISLEFPALTGKFEAFKKWVTPEMNAWIWTHATIMREEGRVICKLGEEFFASVFSGLG
jgi:hypothetical protein